MIRELSYLDSQKYLGEFQKEENSYGADWYDCEDENSQYIWWLDIEKPLGFLSYKKMILPNKIDFVYIVKIYVLKTHRGEEAVLIDGERVSEILFSEIDKKGVNILTLESACEKLDVYYKDLGFEYNVAISNEFASVIGTREEILYRRKKSLLDMMSDAEKEMFGV